MLVGIFTKFQLNYQCSNSLFTIISLVGIFTKFKLNHQCTNSLFKIISSLYPN